MTDADGGGDSRINAPETLKDPGMSGTFFVISVPIRDVHKKTKNLGNGPKKQGIRSARVAVAERVRCGSCSSSMTFSHFRRARAHRFSVRRVELGVCRFELADCGTIETSAFGMVRLNPRHSHSWESISRATRISRPEVNSGISSMTRCADALHFREVEVGEFGWGLASGCYAAGELLRDPGRLS